MSAPVFNIFFELTEQDGFGRESQAHTINVPVSKGLLFSLDDLCLSSAQNERLASQFKVVAVWPDQSIKWLQIKTLLSISKYQTQKFSLGYDSSKARTVNQQPQKSYSVVFAKSALSELCQFDSLFLLDYFEIKLINQPACKVCFTQVNQTHFELTEEVEADGYCELENGHFLKVKFEAEFYKATGEAKIRLNLLNEKAASHPNGLWDLADPNSAMIEYFNCIILPSESVEKKLQVVDEVNQEVFNSSANQLRLYQASSGGMNWNSPVHVNADNQVDLAFSGYQVHSLDRNRETLLSQGKRASMSLTIGSEHFISLPQFWQTFPKGVSVIDEKIIVELFPKGQSVHELQAGEQVSFKINCFHKHNELEAQQAPLKLTLCKKAGESMQHFPFLAYAQMASPIESIIAQGIEGYSNFFQKREVVDEYGWRNFGDLYADHEALEYTGDDIFVSHYNNQYDPIYGFLRQYALTEEMKWLELANDLAEHVKNIDMYHTNEDKAEYNNGLFWHTDHYLPAATATHRTYSKHHEQGAYMDHAGGGGPGGQHCYTTGLMYHYFLTGEQSSKDAVIKLTDWISRIYDGEGGFFEWLLSLKNSNVPGMKNMQNGLYPLDRGIGNYVVALLDSFALSQNTAYLARATKVLKNTIHPNDTLAKRQLSDVENTWFYTVLLQAAIKFLQIKEEVEQLDDDFYYVRDALLHYADWMLAHEYPYLEKPEILEYPNHTWTAQDLRKSNILYAAAYYSYDEHKRDCYQNKAAFFYQYVATTLAEEPTRQVTRILAILMQNHGVYEYFQQVDMPNLFLTPRQYEDPKYNTGYYKCCFIFNTLFNRLRQFSVKQEINWLSKRSAKFAKIINKGQ